MFEGIILVHYDHFLLSLAHQGTTSDPQLQGLDCTFAQTHQKTSFSVVSGLCAQTSPTVRSVFYIIVCCLFFFQHLTDIIKKRLKPEVFSVHLCPVTKMQKYFQSSTLSKSVKPLPWCFKVILWYWQQLFSNFFCLQNGEQPFCKARY